MPLKLLLRISLAGALAGGAALAGQSRWQVARAAAPSGFRGFAAQPMAGDSLRPIERTFLDQAVEISRERVQVARLAMSQANTSDVRAFAQQLAADYQLIGDSVEALRRRKGALETPLAEPKDIVSEMQQTLAQKSGAEFDREFIRFMADQHSATLALFEQAANAKDADVRELAGSYLPTLRDHHNRIVELRKALD